MELATSPKPFRPQSAKVAYTKEWRIAFQSSSSSYPAVEQLSAYGQRLKYQV